MRKRTFVPQLDEHVDDGLRQLIARADLGQLLGKQGSGPGTGTGTVASGRRAENLERIRFALDPPEDALDARRRLLGLPFGARLAAVDAGNVVIRLLHTPDIIQNQNFH